MDCQDYITDSTERKKEQASSAGRTKYHQGPQAGRPRHPGYRQADKLRSVRRYERTAARHSGLKEQQKKQERKSAGLLPKAGRIRLQGQQIVLPQASESRRLQQLY